MSYAAPKGGFRTFLIVWASQSVSVFGSALTFFALNIWLVESVYPRPEQQSQLAWALAALGLALALPGVLATPLAGALADRLDRRRLMLAMDLINGALTSLLCALLATERLTLWALLATASGFAVTSAVHSSAFDTSYAMLVSDEQLPRANGMMQTMWSLSNLFSPAIAAAIITLPALARQGRVPIPVLGSIREGAVLAIAVDAATFFLAAGVLALVQIPSPRRTEADRAGGKQTSIWADVGFGVRYVWRRRPLFWLLCSYAIFNLCIPLGVFLPLVVKTNLAADWSARGFTYETALAAVNTIMALGGIAGGAVVSLWGGAKRRRIVVLMLTIAAGGVAQALMGLLPALYAAAAAGAMLDFSGPFGNAHSQAIWQGQVPRELQGRVFAVRRVMAMGLLPLGNVLAGWMAGVMNPGLGMALLGGIVAAVALLQLLNPQVLQVENLQSVAEKPVA